MKISILTLVACPIFFWACNSGQTTESLAKEDTAEQAETAKMASNGSAEQNEPSSEGTSGEAGKMSAKIKGKAWSADNFQLSMWMSNQLHIEALDDDGTGVKLVILGISEPGTYKVGSGNINIAAYLTPEKSYMSNVLTKKGEIVVDKLSKAGASGTFQFFCGDMDTTIEVTDGKFDVKF